MCKRSIWFETIPSILEKFLYILDDNMSSIFALNVLDLFTKVESPFMKEDKRFDSIKFIRDLEVIMESNCPLALIILN
jgi:hypothetical protein